MLPLICVNPLFLFAGIDETLVLARMLPFPEPVQIAGNTVGPQVQDVHVFGLGIVAGHVEIVDFLEAHIPIHGAHLDTRDAVNQDIVLLQDLTYMEVHQLVHV